MIEYQYELRPKFTTDNVLCMCKSEERFPHCGEVDISTGKGYTIKRTLYWCKNCGLALPLKDRDQFGLTWEQIQQKQIQNELKHKTSKFPEDIDDPLA